MRCTTRARRHGEIDELIRVSNFDRSPPPKRTPIEITPNPTDRNNKKKNPHPPLRKQKKSSPTTTKKKEEMLPPQPPRTHTSLTTVASILLREYPIPYIKSDSYTIFIFELHLCCTLFLVDKAGDRKIRRCATIRTKGLTASGLHKKKKNTVQIYPNADCVQARLHQASSPGLLG